METHKILQSDYLDLIFDNRNKEYGGYELRKHYNSRALKALGIMFGALLLGVSIPVVYGKVHHKDVMPLDYKPRVIDVTDVFVPHENVKPIEKPKVPEKAEAPAAANTIKNDPPKIVEDNLVKPQVKPPDTKLLDDRLSGPVTNKGNEGSAIATDDKEHHGSGKEGVVTGSIGGSLVVKSDQPVHSPDIMPEFPGGLSALLAYIRDHLRYPALAAETGVEGRVILSFVVNAEGAIEGVKVEKGIGAGCDKEAVRVVNSMPKWKPGRQNGKAVKVYYTLPISFELKS